MKKTLSRLLALQLSCFIAAQAHAASDSQSSIDNDSTPPNTATSAISTAFDPTYLAQIDSIMQEQDEKQREQEKKLEMAKKVVDHYNQTALKRESSFNKAGTYQLLRGLLYSATEHNFIKHPAAFEKKDDKHKWTDYAVGGAPLAATWIMKAAGVESRSRTERMLTANAMAMGITFGASQLLKHTVSETRPDMTDDHSFPSGHTTLAFASATILSREYGHVSPWITPGAYATATATQILRMQHNRHWINDLYTGAGIGIIGTNLAYFLTDKIFGSDGINAPKVKMKDINRTLRFINNPSGVSFIAGTEVGNRKIELDGVTIKAGAALSTGFDATWSLSQYGSIDLMARLVEAQTKVFGTDCIYTGDNLRMGHIDIASRWSVPTALERRMGLRAFAGIRTTNSISMHEHECHKTSATSTCTESYSIPSEIKPECGVGLTFECLDTGNNAVGFTFDYIHTFSDIMPNRYSMGTVWKIIF